MPNYTILLVDYEPRSVERSRRPLVEAGFKVHLAPDGVAALEAFERLRPDLVLIEAMLPKKNGFEVCQEIRRTPNGTQTPILITTAVYKGRKYRSQALHVHGANEYIEKPIADDQLVAIVRQFLKSAPKSPGRSAGDRAEDTSALPHPPGGAPATAVSAARAKRAPTTAAPSTPSGSKVSATEPRVGRPAVAVAVAPAPAAALVGAAAGTAAGTAVPLAGTAILSGAAAQAPSANSTWQAAANALIGGLTEDEISERLDELLPLGPSARPTGAPESERGKEAGNAFDLEAAADALAGTDPEFDALLAGGSTTTAPLGPTVPVEATDREEREPRVTTPGSGASDGGVVPFDTRRSKKRGKKKEVAVLTPESPAALRVPAAPSETERAAEEAGFAAMDAVAADAEMATVRRRAPLWVWLFLLAAAAASVVGAYFTFFQTGASTSSAPVSAAPAVKARPSPAPPRTPPATRPVETSLGGFPAASPPSAASAAPTPAASATVEPVPKDLSARPSAASTATSSPRKNPSATPTPRAQTPKSVAAGPKASATNPSSANPAVRAPGTEPAVEPTPSAVQPPQAPIVVTPDGAVSRPSAMAALPEVSVVDPSLGIQAVPLPAAAPAAGTRAPRPVQQGDLLPLADADQPPVPLSRTPPTYPRRARNEAQEGDVSLSVLVDETGRVSDVRVVSAESGDFGEAASKVARTWTYKPALKNGVRVKVWKAERVIFRL